MYSMTNRLGLVGSYRVRKNERREIEEIKTNEELAALVGWIVVFFVGK
jgi:hypothetical protein